MDLQCDLLDPPKTCMRACKILKWPFSVQLHASVRTGAGYNKLLALFWVLFDLIICVWEKCHIFCNHFCEIHR